MKPLPHGRRVLGLCACMFAALGVVAYLELARPDVLLVGNITIDLVDGTRPTGGSVSYAAAAVKAFGLKACVVTVAGPDADLSIFNGLDLTVVPSASTLTFEHTYTWFGNHRRLRVTANPNVTLTLSHVPPRCRAARAVLLGPLTLFDVDARSFLPVRSHSSASSAATSAVAAAPQQSSSQGDWSPFHSQLMGRFWAAWGDLLVRLVSGPRQEVGIMAQGYQRQLLAGGKVAPLDRPSEQLLAGLGDGVSLFLSDVETDSWPMGQVQAVAKRVARMLVTRGSKGATEYNASGRYGIAATPVEDVADTNGAGDTFATAYMVALAQGLPDPAAVASWAASRAVMMPQSCKPHCACDELEGQVAEWGWSGRLRVALTARRRQAQEAGRRVGQVLKAALAGAGAGAKDWWWEGGKAWGVGGGVGA